jgi:hypothetical protein
VIVVPLLFYFSQRNPLNVALPLFSFCWCNPLNATLLLLFWPARFP